jgi:hypothetical protein
LISSARKCRSSPDIYPDIIKIRAIWSRCDRAGGTELMGRAEIRTISLPSAIPQWVETRAHPSYAGARRVSFAVVSP